jgi:hypothetical protein
MVKANVPPTRSELPGVGTPDDVRDVGACRKPSPTRLTRWLNAIVEGRERYVVLVQMLVRDAACLKLIIAG